MAAGFYGKIPSKGDFIQRNLQPGFTGAWDNWLQGGMESSKADLGENWLNTYLVSPLWRFVLSPNLLSPNAVTGVMMPSVDSVGRYFPLTLALELPPTTSLLELAIRADQWYESAEDILLSSLSADFDFGAFEQELSDLKMTFSEAGVQSNSNSEGRIGWSTDLHNGRDLLTAGLEQHFSQTVLSRLVGYSLWWTCGSDNIAPASMFYPGLPPQQEYRKFLNGDWSNG